MPIAKFEGGSYKQVHIILCRILDNSWGNTDITHAQIITTSYYLTPEKHCGK